MAEDIRPLSMCPHCGWKYHHRRNAKTNLVPRHGSKGHSACPGMGQGPRNPESDRRQLWNGEFPEETSNAR